jgi:hypothetical protein
MPNIDTSASEKILLAIELQSASMRHSLAALKLQNAASRILAEAEPQAWNDWHRSQSAEERAWELEQRADPNYDGHPFADTLGR